MQNLIENTLCFLSKTLCSSQRNRNYFRLHEIEVGRQRLEKMKEDNSQHLNLEANLEEKMLAAMEEIQV